MLVSTWGWRGFGLLAIAGCALGQAPAPTQSKSPQEETLDNLKSLAFSVLSSVFPTSTPNLADIIWPSTLGAQSTTTPPTTTSPPTTTNSPTTTSSPTSTSSPTTTRSSTTSPSSTTTSSPTPTSSSVATSSSTTTRSSATTTSSSTTTPSTTTSSTPTAAPVATAKSSSSDRDRNLAIALAVVFGILAFAIFFLLIWYCRRRSKNNKKCLFWRRTATPLEESEYDSWRRPETPQQRHQNYEQLTPVPPPSWHPTNGRYASPEMAAADGPRFGAAAYSYRSRSNEALRQPQNRSSTTLAERSSSDNRSSNAPSGIVRDIHPALMTELPGQSYDPSMMGGRLRPKLSLDTSQDRSSSTLQQSRSSSGNYAAVPPVELPAENPFESQANTGHCPQYNVALEHAQRRSSGSPYHRQSTSGAPSLHNRFSYERAESDDNPFVSPVYEYGAHPRHSLDYSQGRSSMQHYEGATGPLSPLAEGDAGPWVPPRSPHRPNSTTNLPSELEAHGFNFGFNGRGANRTSQSYEPYRPAGHSRLSGTWGPAYVG